MRHLSTIPDAIELDGLAARIRRSSNFRFNWQFYEFDGMDPRSPAAVQSALNLIIGREDLHRFLRESFDDAYDRDFTISRLHEHCRVEAGPAFENVLAAAAADRLGAYSQDLQQATEQERAEIAELFRGPGDDYAFQLRPGNIPGCPICGTHNHHLFTNWFYGVAWDWCLLATWPDRNLLWLGCLTDTD
jgi:hypothetical protein